MHSNRIRKCTLRTLGSSSRTAFTKKWDLVEIASTSPLQRKKKGNLFFLLFLLEKLLTSNFKHSNSLKASSVSYPRVLLFPQYLLLRFTELLRRIICVNWQQLMPESVNSERQKINRIGNKKKNEKTFRVTQLKQGSTKSQLTLHCQNRGRRNEKSPSSPVFTSENQPSCDATKGCDPPKVLFLHILTHARESRFLFFFLVSLLLLLLSLLLMMLFKQKAEFKHFWESLQREVLLWGTAIIDLFRAASPESRMKREHLTCASCVRT